MARRDVSLVDAKAKFADALTELMVECGHDENAYSVDELKTTIALCTREYDLIWADFLQWIHYGDDEAEKVRDVIRASLSVANMWR